MKYFKVQEFVPANIYNLVGDNALLFMDADLLTFINNLRKELGAPITINNWHYGGQFSQRGLRTKDSKYYSAKSQHSIGKALDFDVAGMAAEEVRQWIINNRNISWVKPIRFIEGGVNWVHVDTRETSNSSLILWDLHTKETEVFYRH